MRQIVRASLPLGEGVVLDPFMGGGSTIAAAVSVGYESIGVDLDPIFFKMASAAIPQLAGLHGNGKANGDAGTPEVGFRQHRLALLDES
jgi:DNA modification methylase